MENGYTKTIDSHSYRVKRNEDESYIVFRNTPRNTSTKRLEYRVSEIRVLLIEEANKLLASDSDQYELVGMDPIKVIGQQFFAVLGKKEKVG